MTSSQKETLIDLLAVRAELCAVTFSPQALAQMTDDLDDLDFEFISGLIRNWGKRNSGFPHPHKIRECLSPEITDADNAQEVANGIISAIGKDGHTNPERARKRIGELAWEVVQRMGGWIHLCETLTIQNEGTFRAQIRALAETVSKKAKRGELNATPALPSPNQSQAAAIIGQTMMQKTFAGGSK